MRLVLILITASLLVAVGCSGKRKPTPDFFYGSWLDTTGTFSNKITFYKNGDFLFSERDSTNLRVKYKLVLDKEPIELTVESDSVGQRKKALIKIIDENHIQLRLLDNNDDVVDSIYVQREASQNILSK